jgi:hypothetical protein
MSESCGTLLRRRRTYGLSHIKQEMLTLLPRKKAATKKPRLRNAASRRGKKQAEPLREGDRGLGRPSGLISHSRLRWMRAMTTHDTTIAAGVATAQGRSLIGRTHADKRATTAMTARQGKRSQASSHSIAQYRRPPQRDPPKDNPEFEILHQRRARRKISPRGCEAFDRTITSSAAGVEEESRTCSNDPSR